MGRVEVLYFQTDVNLCDVFRGSHLLEKFSLSLDLKPALVLSLGLTTRPLPSRRRTTRTS